MFRMKSSTLLLGGAIGIAAALLPSSALAQVTAPGFATKPMLASSMTGVEGREIVMLSVMMEPGASSPRHTHPGDCFGAIVDGNVELVVEGQEARRFAPGEAWRNPPGPPHYFRNVGTTPARMVNTLVVETGKPRTQIVAP